MDNIGGNKLLYFLAGVAVGGLIVYSARSPQVRSMLAKAAGKSTITVTASNGVQTSYEVNVTKLESPDTGVQSISLYGMLSLILLGGIGVTIRKIKA